MAKKKRTSKRISKRSKKQAEIEATLTALKNDILKAVSEKVNAEQFVNEMEAKYSPKMPEIVTPPPKGQPKLHKQPLNYLKTTAELVGRATNEVSLFTMPDPNKDEDKNSNLVRNVVSKNTAILGNYLLQLYQENGGAEALVIDNLSPIAKTMGNTNYEIKIYLLYLGGYTYPIIDKDENEGGLTLTTEQLFKIEFKYSSKVAERYSSGESLSKVNGGMTSFIKNEPFDKIIIKPSARFIKALEGKGLGNVLVVNDEFTQLALNLSDMAYKILTYSASNKPTQKIAEDKLTKKLGLEKQRKTQGKPRVRKTILKGFEELREKGHIKAYAFSEDQKMFTFTYSDKFVKHRDFVKKEPKKKGK